MAKWPMAKIMKQGGQNQRLGILHRNGFAESFIVHQPL
jgi:hypothetical protein